MTAAPVDDHARRIGILEGEMKKARDDLSALKGGIKVLMWLLPILCTIGSALGAVLIKAVSP